MFRLFLFLAFYFSLHSALGAPGSFTYQGQIIKPNGQPLEDATVTFTLQLFSPGAEECLLYEETHVLNMTNSNGIFALNVGEGSRDAAGDSEDTSTLSFALANTGGAKTPIDTCAVGNSYTPTSADSRLLRVTFNDSTGPNALAQDHRIVSVPYADSASSVDGLLSSDILQVNTGGSNVLTQANLENVFDGANHTELLALIGGTSTQYLSGTPTANLDLNSNRIVNVANPTGGNDAANKNYVDSNLGQAAVSDFSGLTGTENGHVLTWNGTTWVNQAPLGDSTKLPLAGGTMTGPINMGSNNITNVNDLSVGNNATITGSVSANGVSSSGTVALFNGGNFVAFQAPAGAGDVIWTLPGTDGTANQFLQTNGSGVLTWADATPPVDSVFGRTGAVVAADGDYGASEIVNTPNGDIAANRVQGAIDELDAEKVSLAGDTMTGDLRLNTNSELRLSDADNSDYVGFVAPNNITGGSFVWTLPAADGANGEVLSTDNAGNLSWISPVPADNSINTAKINDGAVTTPKIADNAVTTAKLDSNAVGTVNIINNAVTSAKIIDGAVAASDLADNAVVSTKILDNAVVTNKIANNAVSTAKIANSAVSNSKLADNSVSSIKIINGTISDTDINGAAGIAATKIATGSVDNAEFGYLDGVTSSIQTQLGNKLEAGDITGKASLGGDSGAVVIGSNDNTLSLEADNNIGATLLANGNFGIGTTNPGFPLHVYSSPGVYTGVFSGEVIDGFDAQIAIQNTGAATKESRLMFFHGSHGTSAIAGIDDGLPGLGGDLIFQTRDGAFGERARINRYGQFGIGTSAPAATLDVTGTDAIIVPNGTTGERPGSPQAGMIRYNTSNNKLETYENGSWTDLVNAGGDLTNGGNAGAVVVGSNDSNLSLEANNSVAMTILTNGNVGIGTATPGSILDVRGGEINLYGDGDDFEGFSFSTTAGNASGVDMFRARGTAGTPATINDGDTIGSLSFLGHTGSDWAYGAAIDVVAEGGGTWSGGPDRKASMRFSTSDGFGAYAERMRLDSAGNLGIGTTTMSTALDVYGTIQIADGGEACGAAADGGMIRYSGTDLQFCNGSSWQTLGVSGAGLTSLNGQTGSSQTFAAGSAGNSPAIASGTNVHTLNVPLASSSGTVTSGTISNTDYVNFSNKLDAITGETLASGQVWVGNGSNQAAAVAISGDATLSNAGVIDLSANSVDTAELNVNSVTSINIVDGEVANQDLANNAVTSAKIDDDSIIDADINASAAIAATKIGGGGVNSTEFGYLDGVTSSIQTQLDTNATNLSNKATLSGDNGVVTIGSNDNSLVLEANDSEAVRILANGNVGVGTLTPNYRFDVLGEIGLYSDTSAPLGRHFHIRRSHGGAAVYNGQEIGGIKWEGYTGSGIHREFASIKVNVDGAPGVSDAPGRLEFHTTFDGDSSPTERMRINNAGHVGIGTTAPTSELEVNGIVTATRLVGASNTWSELRLSATGSNAQIHFGNRFVTFAGTKISATGGGQDIGITLGRSSEGLDFGSGNANIRYSGEVGSLSQRNGTQAQEYRIYNTYDGANDEFISMGFKNNSDVFTFDSEAIGTGVPREFSFTGANVGIGTTSPDTSAILDVTSTTQGFLPPRMSSGQRDSISSPVAGLLLYNTTSSTLEVYDGSKWLTYASDTPLGAVVAFNAGTCPVGWSEVTTLRGRTIVGTGTLGLNTYNLNDTGGSAEITLATGDLPAHSHMVDPPATASNTAGSHNHSVDPPNTSTTTNGNHSHTFNREQNTDNVGGGGNATVNPGGGLTQSTSSNGAHSHNVNIAAFNSASSGNHTHTTDIAAFSSSTVGSGNAIDIRQPYEAFIYCEKTSESAIASLWNQAGSDVHFSSGNVGIGTTDPVTNLEVQATGATPLRVSRTDIADAPVPMVEFYDTNSSAVRGSISSSGSGTSFNTTSDARLKENFKSVDDALSLIKELEVVEYNYIESHDDQKFIGFTAQQLKPLVPFAVTGEENGPVNSEGLPLDPMQVDYSKLVALLTKGIQEVAKICEASNEDMEQIAKLVQQNKRDIASVNEKNSEQDERIKELEQENRNLKQQNEELKGRLDQIEKLLIEIKND